MVSSCIFLISMRDERNGGIRVAGLFAAPAADPLHSRRSLFSSGRAMEHLALSFHRLPELPERNNHGAVVAAWIHAADHSADVRSRLALQQHAQYLAVRHLARLGQHSIHLSPRCITRSARNADRRRNRHLARGQLSGEEVWQGRVEYPEGLIYHYLHNHQHKQRPQIHLRICGLCLIILNAPYFV